MLKGATFNAYKLKDYTQDELNAFNFIHTTQFSCRTCKKKFNTRGKGDRHRETHEETIKSYSLFMVPKGM
jgi:hypothetical protein